MPATRARQPRRRHRDRPAVPLSMVRAIGYTPAPPFSSPPGTSSIGIRTGEPIMPIGVSKIQIMTKAGGLGVLNNPTSVVLLDPTTIQVIYPSSLSPVGVYIPFNDPGFRGINGGMLNPGELAVTDNPPRPFPWACAVG